MTNVDLKDEDIKLSKITCGTAFRVKMKDQDMKKSTVRFEDDFTIVTGHRNGKVTIWENTKIKGYLTDYEETIISIVNFELGLVILTSKQVHFWDLNLLHNF